MRYLLVELLFITILFLTFTSTHSQTFRFERPVPDTIQTHGNYLYGEPWFWASGGAHRGLDMWITYDTVYSAADGYVEFAAFASGEDGYEPNGFGNYLRTRSAWNSKTIYIYYAHLSEILVNTGDSIFTGKPIAISGNTGNSSGPHLHFEIRENNPYYLAEKTRRNPELWFSMSGTGAIYGRVPDAEDNTRVDISPDPKPRPPYTTFSYGLTYGFFDNTIGSDDIYNENYAFGDVKPGTYTITALDGEYRRTVTVLAGEVINADETTYIYERENILSLTLEQNYPNPFGEAIPSGNPSTIIKYQILKEVRGERVEVRLVVYDVLGRKVALLVNKEQSAGSYEVQFDASANSATASGLSSGIYYYQLTANYYSQVRKMILLR
ncbi:MAG: peptidoglycan DD-metalloendopeptidase family protein [Melioribacteraceae bacterium]|nr:peptidoglycan DD-metalloendopeptidase family protein [Melioribacteraceae bacterium]